jgi:hypothetical protein
MLLFAAVAGTLIVAMQSPVKADNSTAVASDVSAPSSSSITNDNTANNTTLIWAMEPRFIRAGIGRDLGFGVQAITVNPDYITNITNIVKNDSDVSTLISQGYNITAVHPVISTVIDGNGNVTTKATTASVLLQGANGRALIVVDLGQAKVTKITEFTVTVINK